MGWRHSSKVAASILAGGPLWAGAHSLALAETAEKVVGTQTPPMGHGFAYLVGFVGGVAFFVASVLTGRGNEATEGAP